MDKEIEMKLLCNVLGDSQIHAGSAKAAIDSMSKHFHEETR